MYRERFTVNGQPREIYVQAPPPRRATTLYNTSNMDDDAIYICDSCGEEIVVPIDPSAGKSQEYVEDCPVCCNPNIVHVEIDPEGDVRLWAKPEQNRA